MQTRDLVQRGNLGPQAPLPEGEHRTPGIVGRHVVGIVLTRDFPIYTANWGAIVNLESILQVAPSLRFPMFLEETEQK